MILNAFLLNKNYGLQGNLTQTEFRYLLASALLDYTPLIDQPNEPNINNGNHNGRPGHWPEQLPFSTTAVKNRRKTLKCRFCFVSAKKAAKGATRNEKSTTIIF